MRLAQQMLRTMRPNLPQVRFGTVTSVSPGICTVQVAGGEIPVVYFKGAPVAVGQFVAVQRQGVASYLLMPPSGAIWGAVAANAIPYGFNALRITTAGQQALTFLGSLGGTAGPGAPYAWGCAADGQGGVWLSFGTNEVWRIKGGVVTSVAVTTGEQMQQLALGSDGNMWGCGSITGSLWRFGSSAATQFVLQTGQFGAGSAGPGFICSGPDGALWAVDVANEAVWRVTTSGGMEAFQSPMGLSSGLQGVAGADDALWVVDELQNGIWRVTLGGNFAFFSLSAVSPGPQNQVVQGTDGALWITDESPRVIRYPVGGTPESIPLPQPGEANGICVGPDKNIWVATSGEGEVTAAYLTGVKSSGPFASYALQDINGGVPLVGSICAGP